MDLKYLENTSTSISNRTVSKNRIKLDIDDQIPSCDPEMLVMEVEQSISFINDSLSDSGRRFVTLAAGHGLEGTEQITDQNDTSYFWAV